MADVHDFPNAGAPPRAARPTAAPDLEMALVGALLAAGGDRLVPSVSAVLEPRHFSEEAHAFFYGVLLKMIAAGKPVTVSSLMVYLPDGEVALGVPVAVYLGRCLSNACIPRHAEGYARQLVDLHQRREIIRAAGEIAASAADPPVETPAEALIAIAEAAFARIGEEAAGSEVTHGRAAAAALDLLRFGESLRAGDVPEQGTPCGIDKLDRATGGIQPGDLWVVGGRPGQGKSIVGLSIARGIAAGDVKAWHVDRGVRRRGSLLFSLELSRQQVTSRLLADMAYLRSSPFQNQIKFGDVMRGTVDGESHLWRLNDAAKRLGEMPLEFDWSSRLTVPQIRSRVRRQMDRMWDEGCHLRCVVIDYLKFVEASERYRGQRAQEVAEISGALKQMAKDLGIGVVLLAQLNRQNEMRGDPRPVLSDLKESGDLEADADLVAFVYREEYYLSQSKGYRDGLPDSVARMEAVRGKMELILAKNRSGSTRTIDLFCDVGSSAIDDHDRRM